MKKITLTDKIIAVLKKAGKIKDEIIPQCSPEKRWQGRTIGWALCPKCYPTNNQPERLTEKSQLDKKSNLASDSLNSDRKTERRSRRTLSA